MFLRLKNLMNKLHAYPNNNLENVPTAIGPSEKSTVTFYIDTLNGKNYIQFFENDIDRGYLFFDESRNLKS